MKIWVVVILDKNRDIGWVYTFSSHDKAAEYASSLIGHEHEIRSTTVDFYAM